MGIVQEIEAQEAREKREGLREAATGTDPRDAFEAGQRRADAERRLHSLRASQAVNTNAIAHLRQLATGLDASSRKNNSRRMATERIKEAIMWLRWDLDNDEP